jgi:hypothetical protein
VVTITLGELIKALEALPEDRPIRFDFSNFTPVSINSYRGDYSQLAVSFKDDGEWITAGKFLLLCREAVGETYEGYKGGEYRMTESTQVWVASRGESTGTTIKKIKDYGWVAIIKTGYSDSLY